jgi:hypothetical protein
MDPKPRVFCGSSSESLRVVYEIQSQLDDTATVVPWKGLVKPGDYTLEKLLSQVRGFDFSIFVFAADDMVESRGQRILAARDNVVLELGLFLDRLGQKRTLLVVEEMTPSLHLPSDLAGLTVARFSLPPGFSGPSGKKLSKIKPNDLEQALASACNQIRNAILGDVGPTVLPSSLSGGMVYLLRFLDARGCSVEELASALVYFQTKAKFAELPVGEQNVWKKAAQYACQGLQALGAADSYDGNRGYRISEEGRRLLRSEQLRLVFDTEMKRRKIRIKSVPRVPPGTAPKTR